MKVGLHKLQEERTSHCWSYGSTNHPSSQSRKISIGVMVDSLTKKASEASKEDDFAALKSTVRSSPKGKGAIEERTASEKPKQAEERTPVKSLWVSPKSLFHHGATSDLPGSGSGGRTKLDGEVKNANETSVVPSDDDRLNKFSGVTYERKKKKERVQDFTFATVKHVPMGDTQMTNDKVQNGTTASLRLKLQEILGAVSSPADHFSKSPSPELGSDILRPEHKSDDMDNAVVKPRQSSAKREKKPRQSSDKRKQKVDQMGDSLFKPRQNSDTIETDSECPDHRAERPVTRSLARTTKMQKTTTKCGRSAGNKMKHQDTNISSLEDGFLRRPHATVGGTSTITKKKSEKKSSRVEPLCQFNEKDIAEKIQHWSVSPLPAQKASTLGTRLSHSHMSEKERGYELKKNIPNCNSHNSPPRDFDSPENRIEQEDIVTQFVRQKETIGSPSVRNFLDQQAGLQSPTFGVNTPASTSSLNPTPKTDLVGEIQGFRTPQRKKLDTYGDKQIESSDDAEKCSDSQTIKPSFHMKDAEASLSEASSDDKHSGSSEEDSPNTDDFDRFTKSDTLFGETNSGKKLKSMLRPANMFRDTEIKAWQNHTKTSSPSTKGYRESNWIPKSTENNEVDGLTRALELFALELLKLKSKIKSATIKKSSEILMSVAEDVRLQLDNAETHIQTDMGKLKNRSKLKRKRVETRFEEQQERLQLIYAKFKEQINQHLQDLKSTSEGLEADQKVFKGTLEERKTSHRKLLLEVEESIEILLNDAQKKITATHEVAREKMMQLKQVLLLCLNQGIFG